jgi:hypothetical protein
MAGNKDSAPVAVRRNLATGEIIIEWFPSSEIARNWVDAYNVNNPIGFAEIVIEDVDVMTSISIVNNIPERVYYFEQMCRDKVPQRFREGDGTHDSKLGIDIFDLSRRDKVGHIKGCLTDRQRAYLLQYRYFLQLREGKSHADLCQNMRPLWDDNLLNQSEKQKMYEDGAH